MYDWIAAVKLKGRSAAMVRKFAEANFNARKSPYARPQAEERAPAGNVEPPPADSVRESDESSASEDSRSAEEGDTDEEHTDDEEKPPVAADLA